MGWLWQNGLLFTIISMKAVGWCVCVSVLARYNFEQGVNRLLSISYTIKKKKKNGEDLTSCQCFYLICALICVLYLSNVLMYNCMSA